MHNSRQDKVSVTDGIRKASVDEKGILRGICPVTRCGVFLYHNEDGSERRELRPHEEVFSEASLESIKMIPITMHHPKEGYVDSNVATRESIGATGETVQVERNMVLSSLVIYDRKAVEAIRSRKVCELSLGYTADVEESSGVYEGQPYDCVQRNIRYNHLSVVDQARAGHNMRIVTDGVYMSTKTDAGIPEGTRDKQIKAPIDPITLNEEFDRFRKSASNKMDELDKKIDSIIDRLDASEEERKKVGEAAKRERKKLKERDEDEEREDEDEEEYEDGEEEERKKEVKERASKKDKKKDSVDSEVNREAMRRAKFLMAAHQHVDAKSYAKLAAGRTDAIRDAVLSKRDLVTDEEIASAESSYLDALFDISCAQQPRLDRAELRVSNSKREEKEPFKFADEIRAEQMRNAGGI